MRWNKGAQKFRNACEVPPTSEASCLGLAGPAPRWKTLKNLYVTPGRSNLRHKPIIANHATALQAFAVCRCVNFFLSQCVHVVRVLRVAHTRPAANWTQAGASSCPTLMSYSMVSTSHHACKVIKELREKIPGKLSSFAPRSLHCDEMSLKCFALCWHLDACGSFSRFDVSEAEGVADRASPQARG